MFCVALFLCSLIYGQNVVIQTNEIGRTTTNDDCAYRISGICTTEDIGGVEMAGGNWSGNNRTLLFQNYNNFPVSVIFEVEIYSGSKLTGTIVLRAGEKKETTDSYHVPKNFKLIARRLDNMSTASPTQSASNESDKVIALLGYLYVYPEDLGKLTHAEAMEMCRNMNSANSYGFNNWRLPTRNELKVIMNNKSKVEGLKTNGYSCNNGTATCYQVYMSSEVYKYYQSGAPDYYFIDARGDEDYGEKAYIRLVRTK